MNLIGSRITLNFNYTFLPFTVLTYMSSCCIIIMSKVKSKVKVLFQLCTITSTMMCLEVLTICFLGRTLWVMGESKSKVFWKCFERPKMCFQRNRMWFRSVIQWLLWVVYMELYMMHIMWWPLVRSLQSISLCSLEIMLTEEVILLKPCCF